MNIQIRRGTLERGTFAESKQKTEKDSKDGKETQTKEED